MDELGGTKSADDLIEKKMRQIMERKERREKRKKEKKENAGKPTTIGTKLPTPSALAEQQTFCVGDNVRMRGLTTVGTVEAISGKEATVIFGTIRTPSTATMR